jgi:hypothetical protein
MPFDAAIDDYLHLIVRTRPWTKKREEELLTELEEWLYEQHERRFGVAEITPELAAQYAAAINLSMAERDELLNVLRTFALWAKQQQLIETDQFALAPAL